MKNLSRLALHLDALDILDEDRDKVALAQQQIATHALQMHQQLVRSHHDVQHMLGRLGVARLHGCMPTGVGHMRKDVGHCG